MQNAPTAWEVFWKDSADFDLRLLTLKQYIDNFAKSKSVKNNE